MGLASLLNSKLSFSFVKYQYQHKSLSSSPKSFPLQLISKVASAAHSKDSAELAPHRLVRSCESLVSMPSPLVQKTLSVRVNALGGRAEDGYSGLPLVTEEEERLLLEDEEPPEYAFAVLGDLHLEPAQLGLFHDGRRQILDQLSSPGGGTLPGACVFQLGDLGGYSHHPGSRACFKLAKQYLDAYGLPYHLVLGNHDLEGLDDFKTDAENLAAWQEVFQRKHHWAVELGNNDKGPVCIGLSTVRFRDAANSCHEVYIDPEQVRWFEETLERYTDRPVFVFTHAPPMGSGLVSLQEVHVRNQCAWLNHSSEPEVFAELAARSPQIKLWFSGHYHLSHDYKQSISRVGSCLYVQVGVMGECHRDGKRQSRLVKGDKDGFRIYTLDHSQAALRLDVAHHYSTAPQALKADPSTCTLPFWLATSPPSADAMSCPKGGYFSPTLPLEGDWKRESRGVQRAITEGGCVRWLRVGGTVLCQNGNMLVEYDLTSGAPMGTVCEKVDGREIRLVVHTSKEEHGLLGRQLSSQLAVGSADTDLLLDRSVREKHSNGWQQRKSSGTKEEDVTSNGNGASDGTSNGASVAAELVAVELVGPGNVGGAPVNIINGRGIIEGEVERFERKADGAFKQVYQRNKYKVWKQKKAEQAAAAAGGLA